MTHPRGSPSIDDDLGASGQATGSEWESGFPFRPIHDSQGVFRILAEIKVQEGESIENALRRFKRTVQHEDIIKDIKKHSFYLTPGDKRRAKQALARKRNRKKIRREAE